MIVVNTSPAIHLHLTLPGGIASLPALVGKVLVPQEVLAELAAGSQRDDTWHAIRQVADIECRTAPCSVHPLIASQIDAGEAAVIQTALDTDADAVVLDDRKARRVATMLSIPVTGTLGILVQAKAAGMIASVQDAIAALRAHGIWLDEQIVQRALALAGEQPMAG